STLWRRVLGTELHLEFVNADAIAEQRWPDDAESHAYEAAELAAARRQELMVDRRSYATETVFSHESKVKLVRDAVAGRYLVSLHVIAVPEDLAVDRVKNRVENGGHSVPEHKVRERYGRLWTHIADAIRLADHSRVYDNTRAAAPFRLIAEFERGATLWSDWPSWIPEDLSPTI
ncbi:MAG: zeta toxin family protein, partial [Acidimicrobiales bacterium]